MKKTILIFISIFALSAYGGSYKSIYNYDNLEQLTKKSKNCFLWLSNTEIRWVKDKKNNAKKFLIHNIFTGQLSEITKDGPRGLEDSEYQGLLKEFTHRAGYRTYKLRTRKENPLDRRNTSNNLATKGHDMTEKLDDASIDLIKKHLNKNVDDGITPIDCNPDSIDSSYLESILPKGDPYTPDINEYPYTPDINEYPYTPEVELSFDSFSSGYETGSSPFIVDGLGCDNELSSDEGLFCNELMIPKTPSYD